MEHSSAIIDKKVFLTLNIKSFFCLILILYFYIIILGDGMKKSRYKSLVIILYIVSLFIILFCMKMRLTINTNIKLSLLFLFCLLIYSNGYILVKKLNYNKKILSINLIIYFFIYTVIICELTLFDEILGRQGLIIIDWNKKMVDTI